MENLGETHAAFCEATGLQAVIGKGALGLYIGTIERERLFRLLRHVSQLGDRGLHVEGHFVLRNTGMNLGIANLLVGQLVHVFEPIEHDSARVLADAVRIAEI